MLKFVLYDILLNFKHVSNTSVTARCGCAKQESFSIETHPLSLIVGPYADNSELSYTTNNVLAAAHSQFLKKKLRKFLCNYSLNKGLSNQPLILC